jgi:hypothetical protein
VTSPFNLHSLLRNYLKLFGEDSCVLIHFITFTKYFKIVDGKASKILKTHELPRRLSSPLTQNPGSAPDLQILSHNVVHLAMNGVDTHNFNGDRN